MNTIKPSTLATSTLKSSQVVTLTLMTILVCGIGLTSNTAAAFHPQRISQSSQVQKNPDRIPKIIVRSILRDAAKRSGVPIRNLQITSVKSKTFSNPCIFRFGEICTREYNPIQGWEVIAKVKEDSWTYHVDKSGSQIVLDPKVSVSQTTSLPEEIRDSILRDAQQRSGEAIANLQITQVTPKTFGNPCEFNFGEICTKEYNPIEGWEVFVQVRSSSWTYHVNKSGEQIVLDPKIG
ncbi:hypothetical protein [Iningainema tapete]|uniref:Uncharacterized protein n=1 Tax=Iningainema tapete BLCC-T55 TaxID=2748662 RepID=A0A8J7BXG9_9CYAN|nr:hypothetical protein [Iningainema tapete]MBD2772893.1 hypothetical protein [Iningainema tapete BLCC-T55]